MIRSERTGIDVTANLRDEDLAALGEWIDAVPNDRLAHIVREAARAFARALQLQLAEHDVSFGHWTFLRVLWERDGLTQRELSQQVGVMEPTTYAAVRAMESSGYVVREHLHGNRKNVHVRLTPAGRALKHKLVPLAVKVNRAGVRGIDADAVAAAREVLLTIIANLSRDTAPPPPRPAARARRKAP